MKGGEHGKRREIFTGIINNRNYSDNNSIIKINERR